MQIMTFNIQHGLDYKNNIIDLGLFADFIKKHSPDVCGLNEVRGQGTTDPEYTNQAPIIGAKADYNNYFGEAVKISGTDPYGNAVLSKNSFKSVKTVAIPDPDDGRWHETRSVIKAIININGRDICFLISHFGLTDEEKQNAVQTVCGIIDSIDIPLILMGDFNLCPENELLLPIRERLKDTDDMAETAGKFTWDSLAPEKKIDYIFYRGLECKGVKTIEEAVSDHFPIIAEFDFISE